MGYDIQNTDSHLVYSSGWNNHETGSSPGTYTFTYNVPSTLKSGILRWNPGSDVVIKSIGVCESEPLKANSLQIEYTIDNAPAVPLLSSPDGNGCFSSSPGSNIPVPASRLQITIHIKQGNGAFDFDHVALAADSATGPAPPNATSTSVASIPPSTPPTTATSTQETLSSSADGSESVVTRPEIPTQGPQPSAPSTPTPSSRSDVIPQSSPSIPGNLTSKGTVSAAAVDATSSPTAAPTSHSQHSLTSVILGGLFGTLALLMLLYALWKWRRSRRREDPLSPSEDSDIQIMISSSTSFKIDLPKGERDGSDDCMYAVHPLSPGYSDTTAVGDDEESTSSGKVSRCSHLVSPLIPSPPSPRLPHDNPFLRV
ncbi:hypothetical protein BXZ70DRAFT_73368 [Cristinia sonorae]|uniref:Uncharacterized protein n=1 Tax=Cristinia sonorae TaxID=1940300 RepID=A0A8K0XQR8_9AGAR|nr:hypothetical protein BXZ70DRAFT_73368 [Cristinia sonorae]